MRALASIKKILEITPIQNADRIELAKVDGWRSVVKKNEFKVGDLAVYFEIDSFLPGDDSRFKFLESRFISYDNKIGMRLRTITLQNTLSQGLLLPLSLFPEIQHLSIDDDVTEILNVIKWEPPIPTQLAGEVIGVFPKFIKQTDQTRVQSLLQAIDDNQGKEFEVSIKLDGTSMTVYRNTNDINSHGVCGRNYNLRETEKNTLWLVARKQKVLEALDFLNKNFAFQGELIGEGIQENPEKIKGHDFYVFDIYDIDNQKYLSPIERQNIISYLNENGFNIKHVPILQHFTLNTDIDGLLKMADGQSLFSKEREGLVFKRLDGEFSFKAISNWYLNKHSNR